jgi:hypothetical protein
MALIRFSELNFTNLNNLIKKKPGGILFILPDSKSFSFPKEEEESILWRSY